MLDISTMPEEPAADDWGFVFAGRNTVTALRGEPGMPWRMSEVGALWDANMHDAVPIGHWQGRGACISGVIPRDIHGKCMLTPAEAVAEIEALTFVFRRSDLAFWEFEVVAALLHHETAEDVRIIRQ